MSLIPSDVASSGKPIDYYFAPAEAVPQVLSLSGDILSLSIGGGSVDIASATAVALSTQKLTAVSYNGGLLETNVDGVLTVGQGSAVGSTSIEGGNVSVSRADAPPAVELVDENTATTVSIANDGGVLALPLSSAATGVGNQVQMLSDKIAVQVTKYLKVLIGGAPYWLPLLSENPVGGFKSPSYNPGAFAQPSPGIFRFEWAAVPGAVSYKVFVRDYYHPYTLKTPGNPVDRYGNLWYIFEDTTTNTFYEYDVSSTSKYNFWVYAYDASGNRSELPYTQVYARLQGGTIDWSVSPIYIYSFGNGVSNYYDWTASGISNGGNGIGTITAWNNSNQLSFTTTFDDAFNFPGNPFPQMPQLGPDPIYNGTV